MYLCTRLLSLRWFIPADKWLSTKSHSSSSNPKLFSGSSSRLNKDPPVMGKVYWFYNCNVDASFLLRNYSICQSPVHSSITMTLPRPSCSSSMANSFTMFSCLTFCSTSNSRIWTSCGRMWDSWLKVLTATVSPLCLLTPWNTAPVAPFPSTEVVHHTVRKNITF